MKDLNLKLNKEKSEKINEINKKTQECLNCKVKPCSINGCPLNNDIPKIIEAVKIGEYEKAYDIVTNTNVLPAICGRICPHEKQCQGSCVKGIKGQSVNIGNIEAFIGDIGIENNYKIKKYTKTLNNNENSNKKIAVIGSGPAGLSCAAYLARYGFNVTIYEKHSYLGGLLFHGIPEFRLPKDILEKSIQKILDLGIEIKLNTTIGENILLEDLCNNYDAIFLSCGANKSSKMNIPGEDLNGVYGGNELLENNLHPNYKGKKVAVIGAGNVAIDCARTIKKMGAEEVKIIYRRSKLEVPAERKEIESAEKEKIEFLFQNNIVKILSNEDCKSDRKVKKVELIKTKLIEEQGKNRKTPVNIEGSNYTIDIDYVVMALGSITDDFVKDLKLDLNKYGYIQVDKENRTSNNKIFAGGDIIGYKSTVAWAAKSGRDAGENIKKFLQK